MLDCVIAGGTVVDGSGGPIRVADVSIAGGRIVRIGEVTDEARLVLDAAGRLVMPGFVDVHTHYDAQAFWDPTLSPSPLHGVTSVIGGNCGFSIAPLNTDSADYLMRMLARVEGMPLESLRTGVPWTWTGFGEWLDQLEGTLAVNAGFMVGHSAIRHVVMGERAVTEVAEPHEVAAMKRLLAESIEAGGLGFSSSGASTHNDAAGRPVPSRAATADELIELAAVCRSFAGTSLEMVPAVGRFESDSMELIANMSVAANRPLNWNLLVAGKSARHREAVEHNLMAADLARERGGRVIALTIPCPVKTRLSFEHGFVLDALPGWREVMALPTEEKLSVLGDPVQRRRLDEQAQSPSAMRSLARWAELTVGEVFSEVNQPHVGRKVGDIANETGRSAFDTLCAVVMADQLRTGLYPPVEGDDEETWQLRLDLWRDERTLIGGTDAGAHLDLLATFNASTVMLSQAVRERKLIGWAEAVQYLSDAPARLYGLKERGRLAEGYWADVCVIDPEALAAHDILARHDLPGGAWRLYGGADGYDHVLVNGVEIVRRGQLTGARPGAMLRAGRDTASTDVQ